MTAPSRMDLAIMATRNPAGMPVAARDLSAERVRASLFRLLEASGLCSMATVTPGHEAHINTAYFCYSDALDLYFLSHPDSRHCRNLQTNPSMAMTVFASAQQWGGPDQGLQLFGPCRPATGPEVTQAERLYGQRFPAYASWKQTRGATDVATDYRWYRFVVTRLTVFDERELGEGLFVEVQVRQVTGENAMG